MGDIVGVPITFSREEVQNFFIEGVTFNEPKFHAFMRDKVLAVILEHYHGMSTLSRTELHVESFTIKKEVRPHCGDYLIEVIYQLGRGKWRVVFHYVHTSEKGALNGKLYQNTRRFIQP